MQYGVGYWMNMGQAATKSIPGQAALQLATTLPAGWSIVGHPMITVDRNDVRAAVPNSIISVFRYEAGYQLVDPATHDPMWGGISYWYNMNTSSLIEVPDPALQRVTKPGPSAVALARELAAGVVWAKSQGHRLELPVGVPTDLLVEWPPVPPSPELFDLRAVVDGVSYGQVPQAPSADAAVVRVQGPGVTVGLTLDADAEGSWALECNGRQVADSAESVGPEDVLRVRPILTPELMEESATTFPNPFNPEVVIRYTVPESCRVRVRVYNTAGQLVRTLVDDHVAAGSKRITWRGMDDAGATVASGMYLYTVEVDGHRLQTHKMTFMR